MATINGESILIEEILEVLEGETYLGPISPTFNDLTVSDELIFLSGGNTLRIKPVALSGNRSLTLPDVGGQIVVEGATQDLTSKLYKARGGSASAPSYAFDIFGNSGMYNDGINSQLHFSVNGVEKLRMNTTETISYNAIESIDGSLSVPSYAFNSNRDCGFYYEATPRVSCGIDGVRKLAIGATNTISGNVLIAPSGSASAPSYSFVGVAPGSETGMFYRALSTLCFSAGGVEICNITNSGLSILNSYKLIAGGSGASTESAPAITFNDGQTHGIYTTASNELSFTVNSTRRMFISANQVRSTVPFEAPNGDASAPSYSFSSDPDTGIYRSGNNQISITCGNSERLRIGGALLVSYNAGTTQLSFQRSNGDYGAGAMSIDSSNDLNISNSSGSRTINLNTNNGEVVIQDGTNLRSQETYDDQSGAVANVFVSSSGLFTRIASSIRFKKDVKEYTNGLDVIDKFKPITYRNKFKKVRKEIEIDVNGKKEKKYIKENIDDESEVVYPGLIAEDLDKSGLGLFVDYNANTKQPDSVYYDRIPIILINCIKQLRDRIEVLESRLG
jgi:hypothetical protein